MNSCDKWSWISFAVIMALISLASAETINLNYSDCWDVEDSNGSITTVCAPDYVNLFAACGSTIQLPAGGAYLNSTCGLNVTGYPKLNEYIKFRRAAFNQSELLRYENLQLNLTVLNADNDTQIIYINQSNNTVVNVTAYCNESITLFGNQSYNSSCGTRLYCNLSTIEVVRPKRLDLEKDLGFGGRFFDYDSNLSISCPANTRIDDVIELTAGEKLNKFKENYGLVVSCANSTTTVCPVVNTTCPECFKATQQEANVYCSSLPPVQQTTQAKQSIDPTTLALGIVAVGAGYIYWQRKKKDEEEPDVGEMPLRVKK